jgi:hypothetical protein
MGARDRFFLDPLEDTETLGDTEISTLTTAILNNGILPSS